MSLSNILSLLKNLVPVLEPLGEQGVSQLFVVVDAEIAKLGNGDLAELAKFLSPALKQFVLSELQKLKS